MPSDHRGLRADRVAFSYGPQVVVRDISLRLAPGETLALAGPNGSGKTTLLRLLTGALKPQSGRVWLDDREIGSMSAGTVARRVAVVPQSMDPTLAFTVEAMVRMGRTPHVGPIRPFSSTDRESVERALASTGTDELRLNRFNELSGGEQQRVALAMAIAQDTEYLLLDEPTVHLDLHHQHGLLELVQSLRYTRSLGVLAVMHDLNLASLYFDRMYLMHRGTFVAEGTPGDVLTRPEALAVFETPLHLVQHPQTGVPQVLLQRDSVDR
ncbi:MAG TPA: ABC transporter ATP-binding protein [Chloroflexota bacterium]